MMKNKIRRVFIVIYMLTAACVFNGCRGQKESFFLSEETDLIENLVPIEDVCSETSEEQITEIVVYLCGAVKKPGIVVLPEGSRINDAIREAGGFAEDAAQNSVNLAAKLKDEEMVYVATKEEVKASLDNGTININTADVSSLCTLPGIGESKARDIILYREKNGAFQNKEDIMDVEGIKENLYNKIEALICVK
jgi:competence protein ComEA